MRILHVIRREVWLATMWFIHGGLAEWLDETSDKLNNAAGKTRKR